MSPYDIYQKNEEMMVEDKPTLLIKTFEKIFEKLREVEIAIEEKMVEEKVQRIQALVDVLEIMRGALDENQSEELTKNLDAIYAFCIDELLKANITNDKTYIVNVQDVLTPLYEGFKSAYEATQKTSKIA